MNCNSEVIGIEFTPSYGLGLYERLSAINNKVLYERLSAIN